MKISHSRQKNTLRTVADKKKKTDGFTEILGIMH